MTSRLALLAALVTLSWGCRLDPTGRCEVRADCAAGLDCLEGVCAACRGDFDCAGWERCGVDGLCAPLAGRCDADLDCPSWDACDATHTCALRADHCVDTAACGALERCDPAHHCTLRPGRCNVDADCPAWMASCDTGTDTCLFSATAGDDVLAWGTLAEGTDDRIAVARVTAPAKVEVGFDAGSAIDARGQVDPVTGALVYRHTGDVGGDTLRRFHRDAITADPLASLWRYPAEPSADDEVAIDATACRDTWSSWLMQGGTGALLYGCPISGGALANFYDGAGAARPGLQGVQAALAWSPNDYVLARGSTGAMLVVSPAGAATSVTGLPAGAHLAYRTFATGFRVALHDDAGATDQLWQVDEATAAGTIVGTYVSVAAYGGLAWEVLDSAGALYGRAYVGVNEIVLQRPVTAGATSKVYDEANTPPGANDFAAATFSPYLRLDRSFLLSRP